MIDRGLEKKKAKPTSPHQSIPPSSVSKKKKNPHHRPPAPPTTPEAACPPPQPRTFRLGSAPLRSLQLAADWVGGYKHPPRHGTPHRTRARQPPEITPVSAQKPRSARDISFPLLVRPHVPSEAKQTPGEEKDEHRGRRRHGVVVAEPERAALHPGGVPAGGGLLARVVGARQYHRLVPGPLVPPAPAPRGRFLRRRRRRRLRRRRAPPRRLRRSPRHGRHRRPLLRARRPPPPGPPPGRQAGAGSAAWVRPRRAQGAQPQLPQGSRHRAVAARPAAAAEARGQAGVQRRLQGRRAPRHPPASLEGACSWRATTTTTSPPWLLCLV